MAILTVGEVVDRVAEVGGSLRLDGERVALTLPGSCPPDTEAAIVGTVRANRDAVAAMLRDMDNKAPSLQEVEASLPPGVRLLKYEPKPVPFAVAPISTVTNAGKFFRAYLADLGWRVKHPDTYASPPLADILAKLADAGLELKIMAESQESKPTKSTKVAEPEINAHGVEITDDDIPF